MGRPPKDPVLRASYDKALAAWERSTGKEARPRQRKPAARKKAARKGKAHRAAGASGEKERSPAQKAALARMRAALAEKRAAKAAKAKPVMPLRQAPRDAGQPANDPLSLVTPAPARERVLTAADLPAIVELFKTLKITHLQGEGFELKLTPLTENLAGGELRENPRVTARGTSQAPRARIEGARDIADDVAMAQKLVDDPLAYEQAQIDAQLGHDQDDDGDDGAGGEQHFHA